jgi:hypothetical protein
VVEAVAAEGARELRAEGVGEAREARAVGHVEREGEGLAPARGDLLGHLARLGLVAAVGDHHVGAAAGEVEGHAPAEAAAAAGDERDGVGGEAVSFMRHL